MTSRGREYTDGPTGETISPVIVERWTLSSSRFSSAEWHRTRSAISALALTHGLTNREAAAVVAQSYGLEVRFS